MERILIVVEFVKFFAECAGQIIYIAKAIRVGESAHEGSKSAKEGFCMEFNE